MPCARIKSWVVVKALTVSVLELLGTWEGYNRKKDLVESQTRMAPRDPSAHESHEGFTAPIYGL